MAAVSDEQMAIAIGALKDIYNRACCCEWDFESTCRCEAKWIAGKALKAMSQVQG